MSAGQGSDGQIALGRYLVINHGCGDCHSGGVPSPGADGWLAGMRPDQNFQIGSFKTRARNLTPDNATGLGRFSDRQIFNAIRYGLRPGETPDVEITSSIPGQGNFPLHPKYLAPPMPWIAFRHMSDQDLYAIAAYLKNGVKPVNHRVQDSEGPPDFWASTYTVDKIGPYPAPAFPAVAEKGRQP
jgi:mono/diheme cytochrome c family protein